MNLSYPLFLSTVAARTMIILVALVVGIRIFGKREIGELNLLDLVMVSLLGNAVQNALTFGSGQLGVGLVSAGVLLVADRLLATLLVRRKTLERGLFGEPVILVHRGHPDQQAMQRQGIADDELLAAVHEQGLPDLSQVRLAVLENDGTISVVPEDREA